jgi:hypothetical protein
MLLKHIPCSNSHAGLHACDGSPATPQLINPPARRELDPKQRIPAHHLHRASHLPGRLDTVNGHPDCPLRRPINSSGRHAPRPLLHAHQPRHGANAAHGHGRRERRHGVPVRACRDDHRHNIGAATARVGRGGCGGSHGVIMHVLMLALTHLLTLLYIHTRTHVHAHTCVHACTHAHSMHAHSRPYPHNHMHKLHHYSLSPCGCTCNASSRPTGAGHCRCIAQPYHAPQRASVVQRARVHQRAASRETLHSRSERTRKRCVCVCMRACVRE